MEVTEIIDDIEDITDPSSMEKLLMYVDHIQTRDQEFIELLLAKLPVMEITWEQPWYQKFNSLTRPVPVAKCDEKDMFRSDKCDEKDMFRTDKMTEKERRRIHKNWRKFRKHFDIPDNLDGFARWKNTSKCRSPKTPEERARRFVTAFLAKGLQRTLYQVYKYVLTHYGCPIKGKYHLQEEKLMEVCFYHNARNAIPLLSKVLGREARGIYKKLQEWLNGKEDTKKMRWNLPLATKLLNLLIEYTGVPLEQLKNKRIDRSVWIKLEKEIDHPYIYIQQFWYNKLHVQIFVKKNVTLKKLKKTIAAKLQQSSYRVWRDIRWKELVKEFPDGFTHGFLYITWASVFRNHKEYLKISIQDLIDYALSRMHLLPNRRLKTLAFNDKRELEEIHYKEDM